MRIRPTRRSYSTLPWRALLPGYRDLPIVAGARGVADTALLYRSFAPVRALVTSAVQRQVCTPTELADELATMPRNYSRHFRAALSDVLDGARSIAEAEAARALASGPVPAFELNVPLLNSAGRVVAVADALWRELRAVLEIDSREFHFSETDWNATRARHNRLTAANLAVQHFSPAEVRANPAGWAAQIAGWLQVRAAELGVPFPPPGGAIRPGPDGPRPFHLP